jgi:hypothetical protein
MSDRYLEYDLHDGYVHNWLVAGPQAIVTGDLDRYAAGDIRLELVRHYYRRFSEVDRPPVELGTLRAGDSELTWRYYSCQDDHLVDLSVYHPAPRYLRAWAYVRIESPIDGQAAFVLATNGPADVWLNRQHARRQEHWSAEPLAVPFEGTLQQGTNEVLVRFEATAIRACPYTMSFRAQSTQELSVHVPTYHENVARRQKLERVYEQAHLEHLVSVRGQDVAFRWDDPIEFEDQVGYWLRNAETGLITVYGHAYTKPGERVHVGEKRITLEQGPYHLALLPPTQVIEHYDIRQQKQFPFYVLEHPHSDAYYGSYESRRQEALAHCETQEGQLSAALAQIAGGRWAAVDREVIRDAVVRVGRRDAGSALDLLALVGTLQRHPDAPFPAGDLEQALIEAVLGFRYGYDDPGVDALCHQPESNAILFHACEILCGQQYPNKTFARTAHSGQWHRERGERLAREWLHDRGTRGFAEWDSPACFERDIIALTHLADLAQDEELREWSAILLDKLCFTMAVNSLQGVYGSTHRHARGHAIKSGQLEETSGITRLLWGMGTWNQHVDGLVALAASEYEVPSMIASIAVEPEDEAWRKEHHPGVNKVTYRTPDYMLCCAQDYCPGEGGVDEQIWQATLGPSATVFVNHPRSMSESDAQKPNYWAGNQTLPRVAQYKDTLVAIHRLSADDRLGFCHAYFPVDEFREWQLDGNWAFVRCGNAYLALGCSQGLEFVHRGPGAFRELRAHGFQQVWVCMMGREAVDGSFSSFRDRIRALEFSWQPLGVTCRTHRGQSLSFSWEGLFLVDGVPQPLDGYPHYEGPHCRAEWPCKRMDIEYGDYTLRLRLGG